MNHILSLVSSDHNQPLHHSNISEVESLLSAQVEKVQWLAPEKAVDLYLSGDVLQPERKNLETYLNPHRIDYFFIHNSKQRTKKLLIADMDNTVVIGETLDELADQCGLKSEVAELTERAMHGEMDFPTSLRARVKMLKGLEESKLDVTLAKVNIMPGADKLIRVMSDNGAICVLVSGGFTSFTEPIAKRLGFHHDHGNMFEIVDGRLTGNVIGEIVDHHCKLRYLEQYKASLQVSYSEIVAVGDGANDLAMIAAAGMGVGYHPKPLLKEKAANSILYGDLTALLYAQGYTGF